MSFRWIFQLLSKLWLFLSFLINKQFRKVLQYQPVKYDLYPLSPGKLTFIISTSEMYKNRFMFSFQASFEFSEEENFGLGS